MTVRKTSSTASKALAQRAENGGRVEANSIQNQIRNMEDQFAMAMPKGAEAQQLIRDALTVLRQTPKLAECTVPSVLGTLMTCAQLGLRPGVPALGHAYLVPFKGKATLIIGYQGMIELAHRSGKVKSLIARTVYSNDEFDVDYGLADTLVHKPNLLKDRGQAVAYYAIVKFLSGGHAFVVMTKREVEQQRDKFSLSGNNGPWKDHFEGMAHKTVIRALFKYMPRGTDILSHGMAADESVRVDFSPNSNPTDTSEPVYGDGEIIEGIVEDVPGPTPTPTPEEDPRDEDTWPDTVEIPK